MKAILRTTVVACFALASSAGFAQEYKLSPEYRKCSNAVVPGETEGGAFSVCNRAELKRQDVTLNEVYQQLKGQLSGKQLDALIKGQKAWLKQREDWCQFEKTLGGFPEQNYSWCVLESTLRQIELLRLSIQRLV